ncbi:ATP-dependent RNA helicase SUV3 [Cordyceps fumosorosea ARSEF 2679]|uniref:RNA helicase n=1 Tax=Cordyceps fumosorosea (strain ARSEF 2679) TaxID=1081104 RepID=A0A167R4M2_CORFA|nr:ATP-dependent RNA helicase SUV3 [Cordyceps fumosorosea ARSEF 2679]OAA58266.1 ATP-dependent RNA helicase SUV3 [Cordyceps fumosorosea ARSEF 2679]
MDGLIVSPWNRYRIKESTEKYRKSPSLSQEPTRYAWTRSAHIIGQGHDPRSRLVLDSTKKYKGKHGVFRSTVLHRLQSVLQQQLESAQFAQGGVSEEELRRQGTEFMNAIDEAFSLAERNITRRDKNPLFWNLRDAFIQRDVRGLAKEIQYCFQSFVTQRRFSRGIEASQARLLDLRHPHEWFPATRALQRTVHIHVGPTNSGKTYNALLALEASRCGVYAGPLRLLAAEVYHRLRAKGLPCALITGEEVRIPDDTDRFFSSCTVEMVPLNRRFDVAVIDEIQMIGNPDRGSAWTTALLGVQAKEVHVCGEERSVSLIEGLCATVGDKCVVHRYERLSPLKTMSTALEGKYHRLQKGDAIVAFSRVSLHALKRQVEQETGRRCAIIYGTLPPEVRVQQAALFNDPDNDYDFVVASDAIGMGLNLEIKRVIFESVHKFDGFQHRMLSVPEFKQIGGRAGRYRSAQQATKDGEADTTTGTTEQKVGYVTAMDRQDVRSLTRAFQQDVEDIKHAYIQPPPSVVERFASYFPPDTPLSFLLMRIKAAATVSTHFRLNVSSSALEIADIIQDLPLSVCDRLSICHMPISLSSEGAVAALRAMARVVAHNESGDLLDIQEIPLEVLDLPLTEVSGKGATDYLYKLESLHMALNGYIWLSYRFAGLFRSIDLAFHARSLVEGKLIDALERLNFTDEQLLSLRQRKRRQAKAARLRERVAAEADGDADTDVGNDSAVLGIASAESMRQRNEVTA